jgi:hypothetical protein
MEETPSRLVIVSCCSFLDTCVKRWFACDFNGVEFRINERRDTFEKLNINEGFKNSARIL